MKYIIEDTPQGYRLATDNGKVTRLVYDEIGGHGPVEKLYEHASKTVHEVRAKARAERES